MKRLVIMAGMIISAGMLFGFCRFENQHKLEAAASGSVITIPDNVQQILDKSCIGCHSTNARGEKAKAKLNFDEINGYSTPKLVGKLMDIKDVIDKDEMPPKKFREMRPEKVPTPDEYKTLKNWAVSAAASLMEKKDTTDKQ